MHGALIRSEEGNHGAIDLIGPLRHEDIVGRSLSPGNQLIEKAVRWDIRVFFAVTNSAVTHSFFQGHVHDGSPFRGVGLRWHPSPSFSRGSNRSAVDVAL